MGNFLRLGNLTVNVSEISWIVLYEKQYQVTMRPGALFTFNEDEDGYDELKRMIALWDKLQGKVFEALE